jgi:lysophospholipase
MGSIPTAPQTAVSSDGTRLAIRHWPSEERAPWATLLLVHGLGEHSGRYDHVGRRLASSGLDVHAVDLRGFGDSGGRRAYVDRWSQYHDDVETGLREVRSASAGRPVVLYGHSLGGLVTLGYVLTDRPKPDLLVLTAPAIDASIPTVKRVAARVLSRVLPSLEIRNGFDGSVLSRDETVGERYLADPLNHHGTTARLAGEGLAEQARVRGLLGSLAVPTLVLHGAADGLVPAAASEPLAGLANVTRKIYPGLRHELHNEPEWESVMDDVVAWLRERC